MDTPGVMSCCNGGIVLVGPVLLKVYKEVVKSFEDLGHELTSITCEVVDKYVDGVVHMHKIPGPGCMITFLSPAKSVAESRDLANEALGRVDV